MKCFSCGALSFTSHRILPVWYLYASRPRTSKQRLQLQRPERSNVTLKPMKLSRSGSSTLFTEVVNSGTGLCLNLTSSGTMGTCFCMNERLVSKESSSAVLLTHLLYTQASQNPKRKNGRSRLASARPRSDSMMTQISSSTTTTYNTVAQRVCEMGL